MNQIRVQVPRRPPPANPPSYAKRAQSYRPLVDQFTMDALAKLGVNSTLSTNLNSNDHKISAAIRSTLTAAAYGAFFENNHLKVQSLFGSPRDLTIAQYLNATASGPNDTVTVVLHRPLLVAQDTTRIRAQVEDTPLQTDAAFFLVDVYETPTGPLSPQLIVSWLMGLNPDYPKVNCVQWLGHTFKGAAGVVNNEGGWLRKEDGNILFRSDERSVTYAPHDPCDWLWKTSSYLSPNGTLVWAEKKHIGDMSLYTFSLVQTRVFVTPEPSIVKEYDYVDVPYVQTYTNPCLAYFQSALIQRFPTIAPWLASKSKRLLVHMPTFLALYNSTAHRSYTPLSKQILVSAIATKFAACQSYQLLLRLFPVELELDVFSLTLALQAYRLQDKTHSLICDNALNASLRADHNDALTESLPSPSQVDWKTKLGVLLAFCFSVYLWRRRNQPRVPAALFSTVGTFHNCILAPFYEEWFKRKLPGFKYFFPVVEYFFNVRDGTPPLAALFPLIMHFICNCLPLKWAITIHLLWNCGTAELAKTDFPIRPGTLLTYEEFRDIFYVLPWQGRKILFPTQTAVSKFKPELSLTPRQTAHSPYPVPDTTLQLRGQPPLTEGKVPNPYFYFLPTNVPGYAPARTDLNLYHAVNLRILAAPPLSPTVQRNNWRYYTSLLQFPYQCESIVYEQVIDPWLAHFDGKKRKRYTKQIQLFKEVGFGALQKFVRSTDLFVKTDEVLFKMKNDEMALKPRIIANVHPSVQAYVGPHVYEAQQRLKRLWNYTPPPLSIRGVQFYLTYAGDATDHKLSIWMRYILQVLDERDVAIIVSGDDSLVLTLQQGKLVVHEGDASMYDQSQSFGPLEYEYQILQQLGVPQDVVKTLSDLSTNMYRLKTRDPACHGSIDKSNRPMRDTGGSDTGLGNSLIMAVSWILVSLHNFDPKIFVELGFDMKLQTFSFLEEATFLKGRWYNLEVQNQVDFVYYWGPLPSRILKMGKALVDPRVIYKTKSLQLGAEKFLSDVAHSYSVFLPVPLVKEFVLAFKKHPKQFDQIPEYSVHAEEIPGLVLDEVNTMYWLCKRYDIPPIAWEELVEVFPRNPFMYIESPLITSLARKDYG